VARINAIWPIAHIVANMPAFRAHIAAILRLNVPPIPSCIGPAQALALAQMPPPMPSADTCEQIMGTDLTELSKVNWAIPDKLPIAEALPGLNALTCLQELGPVLVPAAPGLVPPVAPPPPAPGLPPMTPLPLF